jgi:hypothetical protein
MPRSTQPAGVAGLAALALAACAQTSQPPASTTAPIASESAAGIATAAVAPMVAASAPTGSPTPPTADEGGGPATAAHEEGGASAQFRACSKDADCVAVPRAGCCHNGWKEAVAASQADAYNQANACTRSPRPVCPMYMIRDVRVAQCEAHTHLCTMVQP